MTRRLCAAICALLLSVSACASATTTATEPAVESSTEVHVNEPDAEPFGEDSSGESPNDTASTNRIGYAVHVRSAGAEPLVSLIASSPATATITVTASEDKQTSWGPEIDQQSFVGDYDLHLAATPGLNGFALDVDRSVRSLVTDGPQPDVGAIVGYDTRYSMNGLPSIIPNEQEDAYRRASGGLLSTPNLILAVPDEPVGIGAIWDVPLDASGELVAEVTLVAISETTIEIDLRLERSTDDGTFIMTATGTYDRASLFAVDVSTVSQLTIDSLASDNGELLPLRNQQNSLRIYQQVSP